MTRRLKNALVAMGLVGLALSAHADLVTFTGLRSGLTTPPVKGEAPFDERAKFESFTTISGTENFSGFAVGDPGQFDSQPLTLVGLNAQLGCTVSVVVASCEVGANGGTASGRYDTTGDSAQQYLSSIEFVSGNLVLDFLGAPVSAFGFYAIDVGDLGGSFSLILTDTAGGTSTLELVADDGISTNNPGTSNLMFFGFYDTLKSYTSIQFVNANSADVFAIDDLVAGAFNPDGGGGNTPEPMTALLALAGLAAVGASRRRRA